MTSPSRTRLDSQRTRFASTDSIDIPIERTMLSPQSTSTDQIHILTPTKLSPHDPTDKSESHRFNKDRSLRNSSMLRLKLKSNLIDSQDGILKWLDELSEESDEEYPWLKNFRNQSLTYDSHSYEYDDHKSLQESINLRGFNSENIKVKMAGRQVEVTAEKESETDGVKRLQKVFQEITIPDTVDEDKLKCYLTPECVLMLEAPWKENLKRHDSTDSLNKSITIRSNRSMNRSPIILVHADETDSNLMNETQSKSRSSSVNNVNNHKSKSPRSVSPYGL